MDIEKHTIDIGKINQKVGSRVKERRINLGLSRAEVATLVGVSQQQFEKYEKGLNRISAGMLLAIAIHFKVEPTYFFQDAALSDSKISASHQRLALELSRSFLNIQNPRHRKLVIMTTRILAEENDDIPR
jgi:transcriptional regulator with XRE-family HTH domain